MSFFFHVGFHEGLGVIERNTPIGNAANRSPSLAWSTSTATLIVRTFFPLFSIFVRLQLFFRWSQFSRFFDETVVGSQLIDCNFWGCFAFARILRSSANTFTVD